MKYYFCIFDENENPIVLNFSESKNKEETENARYLTEEEIPLIQARLNEIIEEQIQREMQENISPEEFLQLIEEAF